MDDIRRPKVTKRERKLQISYQLEHRVNSAQIYPLTTPTGSTLVIYGHQNGFRLLWRGGRRPRDQVTRHTNGGDETIVLDKDDDVQQHNSRQLVEDFEDEEEELDPDCPYPSIVQDLDYILGTTVVRIAVPALSNSAITPNILRSQAVFVVAAADGRTLLLHVPLLPPRDDQQKEELATRIELSTIELTPTAGRMPMDVAIKFLQIDNQPLIAPKRHPEGIEGHLLVASASRTLNIWSIPVAAEAVVADDAQLLRRAPISSPLARLSFHPSTRSAQVLLAEIAGSARIYDPYASNTQQRRPTSRDSTIEPPTSTAEPGRWVMAFHAPYRPGKDSADFSQTLAHRKKILDAKWILSGKGILALLEDGQWGIWESAGSKKAGRGVEDFAVEGFIGPTASHESVEPSRPLKSLSKLAPMTPNSRKAKAEQLFTGAAKVSGTAARGGVSVSPISSYAGQSDESIAMWYNSDVYSITSIQQFWQRSTSSGGSMGSLYSPGLVHLTDIDTSNENITSISHFANKSSSAGIGQMNTQRDLLISAEYQAIIQQTTRPPTPARQLFQAAERTTNRDQQMLDAGNLDLDGMDRMLDNITSGIAPVARKVGFAVT
ncbi:hypothetical protein DOTSEDRAFT_91513 [Dothistroma septosporum NZE10]|uniref:Nucleoporin NUP37 n=1 Tax=Dothistroma septosporum (strain NZE10 / CBS 128990) TaxID=675120 RepID=N1PG86_DOTSN|nr:hypothetical protein DOTSEDRAFT_91513 [Dothistroma septosporum NZE10]